MADPNDGGSGEHIWTRRNFFSIAGWVCMLASLKAGLGAFVAFLYPRVLFEAATSFRAGHPGSFRVGEVSDRFLKQHRVWIVREPERLYALSAVCTHLGCTPRWLPAERKFKCPCHGSGFRPEGDNFEGPAPRSLERVGVSLSEDGQLVVDLATRFRRERGEWDRPESYVLFGSAV